MGHRLLPLRPDRRARRPQRDGRHRAGAHVLNGERAGDLGLPDSDKLGVWVEHFDDSLILPRSSAVPYYEGER
jgi:hypothetical protein